MVFKGAQKKAIIQVAYGNNSAWLSIIGVVHRSIQQRYPAAWTQKLNPAKYEMTITRISVQCNVYIMQAYRT